MIVQRLLSSVVVVLGVRVIRDNCSEEVFVLGGNCPIWGNGPVGVFHKDN